VTASRSTLQVDTVGVPGCARAEGAATDSPALRPPRSPARDGLGDAGLVECSPSGPSVDSEWQVDRRWSPEARTPSPVGPDAPSGSTYDDEIRVGVSPRSSPSHCQVVAIRAGQQIKAARVHHATQYSPARPRPAPA
jgi:hypothetical protein